MPGTAADLGGVSTPSDTLIWVAGSSATVSRAPTGTTFRSSGRGDHDSTTLTAVAGRVTRLRTSSAGRSIAARPAGVIRKTTNAGGAWTSQTSNTTNACSGSTWSATAPSPTPRATTERSCDPQRRRDMTSQTVAGGRRSPVGHRHGRRRLWLGCRRRRHVRAYEQRRASWVAQASGVTNSLSGISAVNKDIAFAVGTMARAAHDQWRRDVVEHDGYPDDAVARRRHRVEREGRLGRVGLSAGCCTRPTPTRDADVDTCATPGRGRPLLDRHGSSTAVFVGAAWNEVNRTRDGGTTWSTDEIGGYSVQLYGIDAIDENSAWGVGSDNDGRADRDGTPATAFGDYADAGPNWSSGTSIFAACLRQSTGTNVTATWTRRRQLHGVGHGVWKGIPDDERGWLVQDRRRDRCHHRHGTASLWHVRRREPTTGSLHGWRDVRGRFTQRVTPQRRISVTVPSFGPHSSFESTEPVRYRK